MARDAEFSKRAAAAAVWFWLCLVGALPVLSAEGPHTEQATDSSETRPGNSGDAPATDAQAKKQALTLGFVMLGSIIVGGTFLLVLVVMWGNRTRRLARSPLPPISNRDELWFLKPKKGQGILEAEAEDHPGSNIEPEEK